MFKEFNVEFQNVEMIGGADNLLENTKVTKVVMSGDNKMSSLDSTFKNCSELDNVQGGLDLNGVSDIDNILEGNSLIKSINLKNVNNENISASNSFPSIEEINISGDSYNKKAMQNVIASKDWTFDNITYSGIVGDNIVTKETNINDNNKVTIKDTLEQKARGFEIIGQTYENLVVGNGEVTLLDELTLESIDGSPNEFNPHIEQPVCVEVVEGNTVQDESNIYSIGELQEDGTYKIDILTESTTLKGLTKGVGTQVTSKRFMIESKNGSWSSSGIVASSTYKKLNTPYTVCIKVISKNLLDNNYKDYRFAGSWLGSSNALLSFRPDLEVGMVYKLSITPQEGVKEDDSICVFQFTNNAVNGQYMEIEIWLEEDVIKSETQLLIPQQLNKIGDVADKLYWDEDKGHYCIEQNVTKELEVMASPNIIDLPYLNKKYSLDTYMPTTYLQCVDTTIQPSKLLLVSDIVRYKPSTLEISTDYTVQFECKEKSDKKIKLNLGGSEKEVDAIVGLNHVNITTPSELSKDKLFLSGVGNKVDNVMVVKGEMNQYPEYFERIANAGELQDDGSYRVGIKSNEGFNVSIISNNPLVKGGKLYWNKSNKRYEIDRSGVIEVPIVNGDVIDLPRLYQREDTVLTIEIGNIKPSNIKVEYLDID